MAVKDFKSEPQSEPPEIAARRRAMALMARARRDELAGPLAERWPDHGARELKPVESGLVMLRGRDRRRRRAVQSRRSDGHARGRRAADRRTRLSAMCSAATPSKRALAAIARRALAVAERRAATSKRRCSRRSRRGSPPKRAKTRAETAATRVDFFTLVRGEDAA